MHLGDFDQPLLFFGGAYSNLDALAALQEQADVLQIPADRIICTGDIVAYCGQPVETVEAIRDWGIHVLMGNCEEAFATDAGDCGCGFSAGSSCDLLSVEWFNFAKSQLTDTHSQWFAGLPHSITLTFSGKKIQVVHGSITSINQFLFFSDNLEKFREQTKLSDADIIIGGHCGIPFSKHVDQTIWHNAGAIGMPANDGTVNTWYSLMLAERDNIVIRHHPLKYNHWQAAQKMKMAGLDNDYAQALISGLWPSMDVLPIRERNLQGHPVSPETVYC